MAADEKLVDWNTWCTWTSGTEWERFHWSVLWTENVGAPCKLFPEKKKKKKKALVKMLWVRNGSKEDGLQCRWFRRVFGHVIIVMQIRDGHLIIKKKKSNRLPLRLGHYACCCVLLCKSRTAQKRIELVISSEQSPWQQGHNLSVENEIKGIRIFRSRRKWQRALWSSVFRLTTKSKANNKMKKCDRCRFENECAVDCITVYKMWLYYSHQNGRLRRWNWRPRKWVTDLDRVVC